MWRLFLFIAACISLSATVALAGDSSKSAGTLPQVKSLQVGFGNRYKLGCWTPVAITLNAPGSVSAEADKRGGQRLEVQAADGDGVPVWYVGPTVSSGRQTAYVRFGRANQPIRVAIGDDSGAGAHDLIPFADPAQANSAIGLSATNGFVVELGSSIGMAELARRTNRNDAQRNDVITIDQKQALPDQWYGYDGVDMLVISGAPEGVSALDVAAVDAIQKWVEQGGELMICCGEQADKVIKDGPLARFAPGELAEMVSIPAARFGSIENYAGADQRIEGTSLRVPQWSNIGSDHRVLLSVGGRSSDLPIVIRWPLGFGQVTYVSLDLDRPPLADWPNRGKFLEKLLGKHSSLVRQSDSPRPNMHNKQLGYTDLAGQLRAALDQFAGVQLIPFWSIALLALVYIGFLFPVGYWIASRAKTTHTTAWLVFLATIVVFCSAAYALANFAKGSTRRVNEVDLVDVDTFTGNVRGAAWFNIFSPENALYDLRLKPNFNGLAGGAGSSDAGTSDSNTSDRSPTLLLSWFGLPGSGLGGMNSTAANVPLFDQAYTIDPGQGTISGVPLAKWSSQSFTARWAKSKAATKTNGIEANLTASPDRRLRGTLVNRLGDSLEDCVLLFDRWAYPIGKLELGKSIALDRMESQTIDTYLTKRRTIAAHDEIPPYERSGVDIRRIVEVMMFYEAAGGENYAGLLNRYQRFTDMSNQLDFGRVVLVGRGPSGATIEINGEEKSSGDGDRHTSVYRFVLAAPSAGGN